ncbi:MAG: bifunctional diaminohydroxyphosphoribosylaminopyrimidine deaminase/5-amino-6-(5-phosphoribosylamino)uracil reductase RibD [Candidatus Omnitrophica bacterium]|nr:bifunctional diaminohydroxyphosphoribosylaminopyrimidine deaminase/5-amino-6-(5-phosphoribosylamino)uracil reductase RibD [Candidatus Omnitrophota bacterium]
MMKKPYITLKFAQTLDGRIAAKDGSSKWISSFPTRKFTHLLRAKSDAVLIGAKTVLTDNPSLTTRLAKGKNPIRIVIDGRLRLPLNAKIAKVTKKRRTIVITTERAPRRKIKLLKQKGIEFVILPASKGGNIDLKKIIRILYTKGIRRILVEGGSRIITSFLKAGLVDRIIIVISPKILGSGIESVGDLSIRNINRALKLRFKRAKRIGEDIICVACVKK